MIRKKRKLDQHFDPEKYQMICCPHCKGAGKLPDGEKGIKVCSQCGGFGWIKKEGGG